MPERRPFPPSPRRRTLARQAGLTGASPLLVGAGALGAAAAMSAILARSATTTIGGWIAAACDIGAPTSVAATGGVAGATSPLTATSLPRAIANVAAPLLGILAIAAIVAHLAQTRGIWLPRRRIEGAPALPAGPGPRSARAAFELLGATVVGVTAFAWLWLAAPRVAALVEAPASQAALAIAAFLATVAIAVIVLGVVDALLRHASVGRALAMTAEEKRQDERLAAADPRWRARRAQLARADAREAAGRDARTVIAQATVLLLGDDVAVAIAWDPRTRPTPTVIATGAGPYATQLLAHARRQALPVHRDARLAALGARSADEANWPRLAEIIAAVRRRG